MADLWQGIINSSGDVGLLSIVVAMGGVVWRVVKYAYGIVQQRLEELETDRDYWRERALNADDDDASR